MLVTSLAMGILTRAGENRISGMKAPQNIIIFRTKIEKPCDTPRIRPPLIAHCYFK